MKFGNNNQKIINNSKNKFHDKNNTKLLNKNKNKIINVKSKIKKANKKINLSNDIDTSTKSLKKPLYNNNIINSKINILEKMRNKNSLKDNYNDLNDEEMNSLEYEKACEIDKRTFFQFYWSLIKKKQIILFTFMPINDFNLLHMKICLFLLTFALLISVNGLFFTDGTMHKIYKDKGKFNLLYQLPKIIYSLVISSAINLMIKNG